MMHSHVTLPESSNEYPHIWLSDCSRVRIIRCKDDLQHIVQAWQSPKWRPLSYHTDWDSICMRWSEFNIPAQQPVVAQSPLTQEKYGILSDIGVL